MSDDQKKDEKEQPEEQKEQTPLEKAEAEALLYKAGWQRAVADYQNLQKETTARRAEWAKLSELQILEEFIPVYDHFKKAFAHQPDLNGEVDKKQMKNWIDGIGHIKKQFGDILKARSIDEIKTVGERFDTRFHESVGEEAGEGEHGTIVREVDGGYLMGERVVKPARVIIIK